MINNVARDPEKSEKRIFRAYWRYDATKPKYKEKRLYKVESCLEHFYSIRHIMKSKAYYHFCHLPSCRKTWGFGVSTSFFIFSFKRGIRSCCGSS
jgi:hypothetical protein